MLQNAYFLAKIGADTAENEQHFAEILPTDALWRGPTSPPLAPASRRQQLPRQAEEQRGADVDVAVEAAASDVPGFFAERALESLQYGHEWIIMNNNE